jgi:general secretion pathway protein G
MAAPSLTAFSASAAQPSPERHNPRPPSATTIARRTAAGARGVTRFELMLAAAVLGAGLTTFGAWKVYGSQAGGDDVARQRGQQVLTAATDWKREHVERGCPSITQLQQSELLEATARAEDPWGQRYRIRCASGEVQVRSAGKDGKFETADDITLAAEPNT